MGPCITRSITLVFVFLLNWLWGLCVLVGVHQTGSGRHIFNGHRSPTSKGRCNVLTLYTRTCLFSKLLGQLVGRFQGPVPHALQSLLQSSFVFNGLLRFNPSEMQRPSLKQCLRRFNDRKPWCINCPPLFDVWHPHQQLPLLQRLLFWPISEALHCSQILILQTPCDCPRLSIFCGGCRGIREAATDLLENSQTIALPTDAGDGGIFTSRANLIKFNSSNRAHIYLKTLHVNLAQESNMSWTIKRP